MLFLRSLTILFCFCYAITVGAQGSTTLRCFSYQPLAIPTAQSAEQFYGLIVNTPGQAKKLYNPFQYTSYPQYVNIWDAKTNLNVKYNDVGMSQVQLLAYLHACRCGLVDTSIVATKEYVNSQGFITLLALSATMPLTYDNTTGVFSTSINPGKLSGRYYPGGAGPLQEIDPGFGLDLTTDGDLEVNTDEVATPESIADSIAANKLWFEASDKIYREGRVSIGDTSGTKMLDVKSMYPIDTILGENLIENAGFTDSLNEWDEVENIVWNDGVLEVNDPGNGGAYIRQDGILFEAGKTYQIKIFLSEAASGAWFISGNEFYTEIIGTGTEYTGIFQSTFGGIDFIQLVQEENLWNLDSVYLGLLTYENDTIFNVSNIQDESVFSARSDGTIFAKAGLRIPNLSQYSSLAYDSNNDIFIPGLPQIQLSQIPVTSNRVVLGISGFAGTSAGLTYSGTAFSATGTISASTGYKINGANATSGNYLRGNGTNFVSSQIVLTDIPATATRLFYGVGASAGQTANMTYDGTALNVNSIMNATVGFRVNGGAALGRVLRGDGTNFVSSPIMDADIPAASASKWTTTGSDIYRNSKVRIGSTAVPAYPLDVVSDNATAGLRITSATGANRPSILLQGVSTTATGYVATLLRHTMSNGTTEVEAGAVGIFGQMQVHPTLPYATYMYFGTETAGSYLNNTFRLYPNKTAYFDGNVGIGTTGPSTNLHIYGASTSAITVARAGVPGTTSTWNYSAGVMNFGTTGSDGFQFITNNIARVTMSASSGSVSISSSALNDGQLVVNSTVGTPTLGVASTAGLILQHTSGTGPSVTLGSSTSYIYLQSRRGVSNTDVYPISLNPIGGSVGVGVTSPAAGTLLDVNGVINTSSGYRIANAASNGQYLRGNGTNFVSSALSMADIPATNNQFVFGSGGVQAQSSLFTVANSPANQSRIQVNGSFSQFEAGIGNAYVGAANTPSFVGSSYLNSGTAASNLYGVKSGGSVGAMTDWAGSASEPIVSVSGFVNLSSAPREVSSISLSGDGTTAGTSYSGKITFTTSNGAGTVSEKMRLTKDGYLWIGTISGASVPLDVNGVINTATGIRIANAATVGNVLRGNGTNFVSSPLAFADLSSKPTTLTGYGITDAVANTRNVSTSGSLSGGGNLTADRTIQLVNDNAAPGNSKYYGTNGSGTKGFYDLPVPATDLGSITNGYVPLALNDTLVNSLIYQTGQTVAVGTNTGIDTYSRFYVYGGANGANLDVRPGGGGYNQAILDLQSDDFANNFQSTYLVHYSTGALGTTFGTSNVELGLLQFNGDGAAIKSFAPIQIGIGSSEKMRVHSTGVAIGTQSPSAVSILDLASTTQGLGNVEMTQAQRDVISPGTRKITIYCTDCTPIDASAGGVLQTWNGTVWKSHW